MPIDFWTYYWAFVSFVFGAITGSFLNVCIWRMPRDESLSSPPSHCPNCNTRLRFWPDMVPILSQLWYRSHCRYCGQKFSWRYLWVELFTAVVFLALYFRYVPYGPQNVFEDARSVASIPGMLFAACLIAIFFIDFETYGIPDRLTFAAIAMAVARDLMLISHHARPLWQTIPGTPWHVPMPLSIVGGLVAFWAMWQFAALATAALGKEAMGGGDTLLLGAMGAYLIPWPLLVLAFLLAVALGTVGGVAGILLAGRSGSGSAGPTEAAPNSVVTGEESQDEATGAEPDRGLPELSPSAGHRGAVGVPEAVPPTEPEGPEVPTLPPGSRWGRLWAVVGTWVAVGALWGGASTAVSHLGPGIAIALVGLAVGVVLFRTGIRMCNESDPVWTDDMDELFEGDPGPRFIPFGPYLVAGTFLAILFGRAIIEWYLATLSPGLFPPIPWS
jgi:leader peptidase (prepilin peptidase)/N-methyltransferase